MCVFTCTQTHTHTHTPSPPPQPPPYQTTQPRGRDGGRDEGKERERQRQRQRQTDRNRERGRERILYYLSLNNIFSLDRFSRPLCGSILANAILLESWEALAFLASGTFCFLPPVPHPPVAIHPCSMSWPSEHLSCLLPYLILPLFLPSPSSLLHNSFPSSSSLDYFVPCLFRMEESTLWSYFILKFM